MPLLLLQLQEANDAVFNLTEQLASREGELAEARQGEAALREQLAGLVQEAAQRAEQLASLEVGGGAVGGCHATPVLCWLSGLPPRCPACACPSKPQASDYPWPGC